MGRDKKILKRKGQAGSRQGVGALKKGGLGNPLTNYGLQMSYFLELCGQINEISLENR